MTPLSMIYSLRFCRIRVADEVTFTPLYYSLQSSRTIARSKEVYVYSVYYNTTMGCLSSLGDGGGVIGGIRGIGGLGILG